MKIKTFLLLSTLIVPLASCGNLFHKDSGREGFLNFYSINDYHGRISYNETQKENGISRVSAFLNEQKYNHELEYVFVSAGDLWQDTYESNSNKGACLTEIMDQMGCEAMELGNHEFDWGLDTIKENRAKAAHCEYLGANIYYFDNETNQPTTQASDLAAPYKIVERNGYKIGLIGIIGENQITSITSPIWDNLTFVEPTEVVTKYSNELRNEKGCDLVLLLAHCSVDSLSMSFMDTVTSTNSETGKAYIDAAFTAHTHTLEDKVVNGIPFVQGEWAGNYVSHIEFDMRGDKPLVTKHESVAVKTSKTDAKVDKIVKKYITKDFKNKRDEVVCTFNDVSTISTTQAGRLQAIATYELLKPKADELNIELTAVINNGGRDNVSLPSDGKATREMLFNITPFTNKTIIAEVTGANLLSAIRNNKYYAPKQQKISPTEKYFVACIDYVLYHKTSDRKYDTFSQYDGNTKYIEETFPDAIIYNYCKGKTIDKSLFRLDNFTYLS
mgnify:CR=1 FL=1